MGIGANPKNDPTLFVLGALLEMTDFTISAVVDLGLRIFSQKYRTDLARRKAIELAWRLKQRGFLVNKKRGDKASFILADKARIKIFKKRLALCQKLPKGEYVVVIFDIPQKQKNVRDELRWFLKQNDFFKIQQSVWATDRRVYKELKDLINELGIGKWTNVFLAKNLLNSPNFKVKK